MHAEPQRSSNVAMIPWIIALMLSLGWALVAPELENPRKSGDSDQTTLIQSGDHTPTPHGRVSNPQVLLAVPPGDAVWISATFRRIYGITGRSLDSVAPSMKGAVRERAPPVHT